MEKKPQTQYPAKSTLRLSGSVAVTNVSLGLVH